MTTAVNNAEASQPTQDLLDHLRAGGKSLSDMSQTLLKQLARNSVSRLTKTPEQQSVINMKTENQAVSNKSTNNASQLFRQQLPGLTRQLLGKRFNTVNKLANMVMPTGTFDKASDQILELLADFASTLSDSKSILEEAGVDSLAKLQEDPARSGRLARALGEKNRYIAMAQGAISGATGVVGAASDIPLSMILVFRTVYLTGRSYGFELNQPQDRALIFDALSNVDLSLVAEKQAILLGLRSLSTMLGTGNLQSLQTLLGTNHDVDPLVKFLSDENGQLKWRLSPAIIDKLSPVVGGAVGAIYNARLLKEVSESAQQVFEQARQQALGHSSGKTSLANVDDKIVNPITPSGEEAQTAQQEAQASIAHNDDIEKVEIVKRKKGDAKPEDAATQDETIHDQLGALADEMITNEPEDKAASEDKKSLDSKKSSDNSTESSDSKKSVSDSNKETKKPKQAPAKKPEASNAQQEAQESIAHNDDIENVEVIKRVDHDDKSEDAAAQDEQIHNQLDALADKMVSHDSVENTATDEKKSSDAITSTTTASSKDSSGNGSKKAKTTNAKNSK